MGVIDDINYRELVGEQGEMAANILEEIEAKRANVEPGQQRQLDRLGAQVEANGNDSDLLGKIWDKVITITRPLAQ